MPHTVTSFSLFERVLNLFTRVRPGEGRVIGLMLINATLLMLAYYILKPVREALVLTEGGAEIRTYATGAQALLLMVFLPVYGAIFRMKRKAMMIQWVYALLALGLVGFFTLLTLGFQVGFEFYVFAGALGVLVTSQFWAFATDLFSVKAGQRLFAIIAFGISMGSLLGAQTAKLLFNWLGAGGLILLSAGLFILSLPLNRMARNAVPARARAVTTGESVTSGDLTGGLLLVLRDRYLMVLAGLVILLNLLTTTGEYVMFDYVVDASLALPEEQRQSMIAAFTGDLFSWITIISTSVQLLLVSRIIMALGVQTAVVVAPAVFSIAFIGMAVLPMLAVVKWGVVAIKSLDYSLLNTCRNALLLPASREAKYEAKTAIDTFFFRCGDLLAAGTVYLGVDKLGWDHGEFLTFNVVTALVMVAIAVKAGRGYARKVEQMQTSESPG